MPKGVTTADSFGLGAKEDAPDTRTKKKAKLVKLPWVKGDRPRLFQKRAIKMIKPGCDTCQGAHNGQPPRGWWDECTHQPYFNQRAVDLPVDTLVCDGCSEEVPEGTLEHCEGKPITIAETKIKRVLRPIPQMVEVRVDQAENSGGSVSRYRLTKGYRFPQELGFAPMCEFSRCWSPEITEKTTWGNYCSREHASLAHLAITGEAIEISDERRRAQQAR
jgi:hypothetical protein